MDLVHDIDTLTDGGRGIDRLVPESTHLIDAVVGGGVQLQNVQNGAVLNAQTGRALVAGVSVHGMLAVDRPGEDLGAGGFARSTGSGEQVCVGQTAGAYLPLQGFGDMLLTHHIAEGAGAPFSV